jgi:HK97 family phage prohead protease
MRFAGYAAVFNRPDRGGDVIRRGAFAASLKRGAGVPLLIQHRAGAVIGRIEHLSEDTRGLRVIAQLGCGEAAREAARRLAAGSLDALSFGYRVVRSSNRAGLRELDEVELVEVSLVDQPMQPAARIHAVEG